MATTREVTCGVCKSTEFTVTVYSGYGYTEVKGKCVDCGCDIEIAEFEWDVD